MIFLLLSACTLKENQNISDKEPSKYTFQDLEILKEEIDKLGLPFVFIIPEEKLTDSFENSNYNKLPDNHKFLVSKNIEQLYSIEKQVNKPLVDHLPLLIISNNQGEISYLSSGYKIGIGEEILKIVKK